MRKVALGIDLGGTGIKLALVGMRGEIYKAETVSANSSLDLSERLKTLVEEINLFLGKEFSLTGIGLAFPGIVDFTKKRILSKYVKYPKAQDADFETWGSENWGVPVIIENDARAALVGEWQYGAGKGANDLVMFTLGTGVGSAVLLNSSLLRGRNSLAGNLGGHMSIDFKGMRCNCGNIGCVETVGSTWAISSYSKKIGETEKTVEKNWDFKNVFFEAAVGNPKAVEIRNQSLEAWAAGIINFVLAYDPERVILGGGIMQSKDQIIPFIQEKVNAHSWFDHEVLIVGAEQTKLAGILGICYLLNNKI